MCNRARALLPPWYSLKAPTPSAACPVFIVHFVDLERFRAEHRHGAKLAPPLRESATYTVRTGCGDDVSRTQESHAGSARVKVPGDRGGRSPADRLFELQLSLR